MERLEQINLYLAFYKHLLGSRFLNAEAKDCTEKVYEHRHSYIWFKKMSISVCDGQSPLYIRQRIKIKLLIVDHNKKWSNGGGGGGNTFFGVINLAEGFQGEVTEQQYQADGGPDSAVHGSSSPPALGRQQCQNPACPGLCQPTSDISFAFHVTHLASAAQEKALGPILPAGDRGSWDLLVRWGPQFSICRRNEMVRFFPSKLKDMLGYSWCQC